LCLPLKAEIRQSKLKDGTQGFIFADAAKLYSMSKADYGSRVEFKNFRHKITFVPPKRELFYNNIRIVPGYAPEKKVFRSSVFTRWMTRRSQSEIVLSNSDWNSTIYPLLNPASAKKHRVYTITLDAGHGGGDTGALGKYSREKNITLRIAKRTAALLRACNYNVVFTRSNDQTLSLDARRAIQKRQRSDLFVSIHVNAVKQRTINGIETFALTPADAPSTGGKKELRRNPANVRDGNNFLLAYHLQKALLSRTGAVDRGVKRARFAVLKDITAPGALVEVGFITNAKEEKLLNTAAYIEKISRAIAEGIISYHRTITYSK
jgi:N-acetylmuramoyl-L-alanine amidase